MLKHSGPMAAGILACVAIVSLGALFGGQNESHNVNRAQMNRMQGEKSEGSFSGGFVDIDNQRAMEHWARHMCRRVNLKQAAAKLGTSATVPAVARALMERQVESPQIHKAIVSVCEDELRKANKFAE